MMIVFGIAYFILINLSYLNKMKMLKSLIMFITMKFIIISINIMLKMMSVKYLENHFLIKK